MDKETLEHLIRAHKRIVRIKRQNCYAPGLPWAVAGFLMDALELIAAGKGGDPVDIARFALTVKES